MSAGANGLPVAVWRSQGIRAGLLRLARPIVIPVRQNLAVQAAAFSDVPFNDVPLFSVGAAEEPEVDVAARDTLSP